MMAAVTACREMEFPHERSPVPHQTQHPPVPSDPADTGHLQRMRGAHRALAQRVLCGAEQSRSDDHAAVFLVA